MKNTVLKKIGMAFCFFIFAGLSLFAGEKNSFQTEGDDGEKIENEKWQAALEIFKNAKAEKIVLEDEVLYIYPSLKDLHKLYPKDLSKVSVKFATYYVLNRASADLGYQPCYMMNATHSFDAEEWVFENGAPMTFYLELTGFRQMNTREAFEVYKAAKISSDVIVRYDREESEKLLLKKSGE